MPSPMVVFVEQEFDLGFDLLNRSGDELSLSLLLQVATLSCKPQLLGFFGSIAGIPFTEKHLFHMSRNCGLSAASRLPS